MKKIEEYIELINKLENQGKSISIETINKKTKQEGIAVLLKNNLEVKVYEGAPDGSDDRIYGLEEFNKNYNIEKIVDEYEEEFE